MYHGRTSMTLSPSPHDDTLRVDWRSCSCCSLEAFFKAAFVSANAWTSFSSDATAFVGLTRAGIVNEQIWDPRDGYAERDMHSYTAKFADGAVPDQD